MPADASATTFLSKIPPGLTLTSVEDVAVDSAGNIYVVNSHNVKKLDSSGNLLLEIGSEGSAEGQFSEPGSIALDSAGNIYVADWK